MIWHIIWNNTIYGCGIYECILLYTIRIWYGTVIEDILGIYKPTIFNIGEIDKAIYIWLYLVCQSWDTKWRLLPGKKAKNIMGDMIINVFLQLGYTVGKLMIKEWNSGEGYFQIYRHGVFLKQNYWLSRIQPLYVYVYTIYTVLYWLLMGQGNIRHCPVNLGKLKYFTNLN